MDNYYGRFAFIVEWYDVQAALARKYILTFYCSENSVEMYDMKNNRVFLKKCKVDDIHLKDLYIGNSINLMSRLLDVVDYADSYTRRMLSPETEKAFLIVLPDAFDKIGSIMDFLICCGFRITRLKSFKVSVNQAEAFYADIIREMNYRQMFLHMSSGPVLAIEVMKQDALCYLLKIVGPKDPEKAKVEAPDSFRARFGVDAIANAIHCPESVEKVEYETNFFFGSKNIQNSAILDGCTCVVIKPHAVSAGQAGKMIQSLTDCGYEVTAAIMYKLDKLNAAEFYEIYKGVVSDYVGMVEELCRNPCIALEVRMPALPCCTPDGRLEGAGTGPQMSVRDFVGPVDPDLARKLRPCTLRATYGSTRIQNAAHVTDLVEDSFIELEYFFRILDS